MFDFNLNLSAPIEADELYDVIIIGGGPAGLTAGLYLARYKTRVLMIEKMFSSGGQMASTQWVENYPGFPEPVLGQSLANDMEKQALNFGLLRLNAYVDRVELADNIKKVWVGDTLYQSKAVLITTGASPRKLGFSAETTHQGNGISYCATCDGPFYPDKEIAVIGGGNSACEESLFLAKYARKITVFQNLDHLTAEPLIVDKLLNIPSIEVKLNSDILDIDFSDPTHRTIKVRDTGSDSVHDYPIDGLFIFVGMIPNTVLFQEILDLQNGYIKINEKLETSLPGVYAAGDVIVKDLRQVATAVGDGALAAYHINKYLEDFSS